jgi:DnaJ-domain-containing protein 1
MVKLDVRRDYYADLGLTPSADAEDIKKQFRKLGEENIWRKRRRMAKSSESDVG